MKKIRNDLSAQTRNVNNHLPLPSERLRAPPSCLLIITIHMHSLMAGEIKGDLACQFHLWRGLKSCKTALVRRLQEVRVSGKGTRRLVLPVVYKGRGRDCSSILIGSQCEEPESENKYFQRILRGPPGREAQREVGIIGVIFPCDRCFEYIYVASEKKPSGVIGDTGMFLR